MTARAVTTLILATVSLCLAFAAGRISTLIGPVTVGPANSARVTSHDVAPRRSAVGPAVPARMIEAAIGDAKPSADVATSKSVSGTTPVSVAREAAELMLHGMAVNRLAPAHNERTVSAQPTPPTAPAILNFGSAASNPRKENSGQAASLVTLDGSKTDDVAIAQCERRYSSFRRSDGTYQPRDGGPRKRCPLHR